MGEVPIKDIRELIVEFIEIDRVCYNCKKIERRKGKGGRKEKEGREGGKKRGRERKKRLEKRRKRSFKKSLFWARRGAGGPDRQNLYHVINRSSLTGKSILTLGPGSGSNFIRPEIELPDRIRGFLRVI